MAVWMAVYHPSVSCLNSACIHIVLSTNTAQLVHQVYKHMSSEILLYQMCTKSHQSAQYIIGLLKDLCFTTVSYLVIFSLVALVPPVLWYCWLGGRKGIQPQFFTEWWDAGMVICLERVADLHVAQLMPLPLTVPCSSKIQIGFTLLVLAHLGSPGKKLLNGCVCVC